jgi:Ca-activated chloride channel family protein
MKKTVLFLLLAAGLCSCVKNGYHEYIGEHPGYNGGDIMPPGDYPPTGDHFDLVMENPFIRTAEKPVSSFSVDADGASYAYMRRCATTSGRVDPSSVRIEEYLNYFTFDYPEPTGEETLGINAEASACPWAPDHLLLRLGLKGKSIPESQIPAANYILLIDTSGSMSGSDRMDLVKTGLCAMVDAMRPDDRIAIITYSGSVQKLVESTLISTGASAIKAAIRGLFASGGTAGGPAMKMAYEEASAHYIEGGNNRIIMCTDGDFNVGVSSTEALVKMVESYQKSGIYLSIMGFGTGNYQDSRMESLSNHGNGTYNYIDSEQEMIKVFVNERSHFWAVANDSKCQIRFNPEAVAEYRLLGYENRLMSQEEFEDSSKDAGEIGAGQTVTALYEIIPAEGYTKNASLATFETRYKFSLKDTESRSLITEVKVSDTASENMNFAAGVAAYAMVLRNSMYKGKATLSLAKELVSGASTYDPDGFRAELLGLMEIVRP